MMRVLRLFFFTFLLTACSGGDKNVSEPPSPNPEPVVIIEPVVETTGYYGSTVTVDADIAGKFLTQATFGAKENQIDALVSENSLENWIDEQINLPISLTQPYVEASGNGSLRSTRHDIWWKNVIENDDQLRQRMAFALSQIFVISDNDYTLGNAQYGVTNFYDMLAENAFGDYRTLLEKVTLHPTMGIYLGMVRNQKANPELRIRPDENYAREVLQLFSIGLYELNEKGEALPFNNPTPTFDQTTVEEFAKVFTGWNFSDSAGIWVSNDLTTYDKRLDMMADYDTPTNESFHDTSAKTLLSGEVLASSVNSPTHTEDDMQAALDNIANHPNVAPFFSKLLIQHFTTSNPSADYVGRVASVFNDNGQGVRGDLGEVIKAILLDEEAISGKAVNPDFGKVKEPLLQLSQLWRAFNVQPGVGAVDNVYRYYAKASEGLSEIFGQAVLKSPSVFNFYSPDNLLAGNLDLLAPEMQIMTEANIASIHNAMRIQVYAFTNQDTDGWNVAARINIDKAVELAPNPEALVDHLNKLLLSGRLDATKKNIITNHLDSIQDNTERAKEAIFLIIASSQFMVQE